MKPLDRFIQKLRIRKAIGYLPEHSRLLDIGCADGAIFLEASNRVREGVGIDPGIQADFIGNKYRLIRGSFPGAMPAGDSDFDAATLLAVLEHIPVKEQSALARDIYARLKKDGVLIITVPSPQVDKILAILMRLRVIDGMSVEQHFGFDVETVAGTFAGAGLKLERRGRFQFGLNNVFVFRKP